MPATDLWPDFQIEVKPRGVRQMLEDAGRGLKEKTKGLVEFRVWAMDSHNTDKPFRYRCDLHVENIDYAYRLLEVDTSATGFPVAVRDGSGEFAAADEPALLAALERIFRSDRTVAIVQTLVSMAYE